MAIWQNTLNGKPLDWLLAADNAGVRYLALRDLCDLPKDDPDLLAARKKAHQEGPIAAVLRQMDSSGFWVQPGPGYSPKYRSTVWSILLLAQLGAVIDEDERIATACQYLLGHNPTAQGQFSITGAPTGNIDCLQGNLCWALTELGFQDERMAAAYEWMARSVTGEGIAPMEEKQAELHYLANKCGPKFACGMNGRLPCAWGAAKVLLAFGNMPVQYNSPITARAVQQGVRFLLETDPADARYPMARGEKPSQNWWKLGFPLFYITDLLQVVEALVGLGFGQDARLQRTINLILEKQDPQGRWLQEHAYADQTWGNFGKNKQPNQWVTLRALRVLKAIA